MSDRRSAILDAAINVIARRGVRGLRVEHVAAEAGVAVSLIYYYFGSRNGLVRATLDHANERAATTARRGGAARGREKVERSLLAELDDGDPSATRRSCGARSWPRPSSSPSCASSCARRPTPGRRWSRPRSRRASRDGSIRGDSTRRPAPSA